MRKTRFRREKNKKNFRGTSPGNISPVKKYLSHFLRREPLFRETRATFSSSRSWFDSLTLRMLYAYFPPISGCRKGGNVTEVVIVVCLLLTCSLPLMRTRPLLMMSRMKILLTGTRSEGTDGQSDRLVTQIKTCRWKMRYPGAHAEHIAKWYCK